MIRITKREGIMLQIFLGVILILSLYKLCIEKKFSELESVRVKMREAEDKFEELKNDRNSRESSHKIMNDEEINKDVDMIDVLEYILHGVKGENMSISVLDDGGYDTFKRGREIAIEGEVTLTEFYEIIRLSEEVNEKIKIDTFKLIFIHEGKIKCSMRMRIF